MENKIVNCNSIEISNKNKICLIAGPCQLETEQHAMDMDLFIKLLLIKPIELVLRVKEVRDWKDLYLSLIKLKKI